MRTALIASALCAVSGAAHASATMDILSAERQMLVIACGFDYEFNDCAGDNVFSTATSGFYDQNVTADLDDYYAGDIADASGQLFSNITSNRIELEYFADCTVSDAGIFSADAGVQGETTVEFEVLDDVRVVFEGYAEGYEPGYFVAGASLREVGGPSIASFAVQGEGDDGAQFTGWLYAGTYEVSGSIDAGTASVTVDAAGELSLSFRVYHKTDFNTDGTINRADRDAFITEFRARTDAADYNGDGVTDRDDRVAFIADWRVAKTAAKTAKTN